MTDEEALDLIANYACDLCGAAPGENCQLIFARFPVSKTTPFAHEGRYNHPREKGEQQ